MATTYITPLEAAKGITDLGTRAIVELYASTYHPTTVAPVGPCNGVGVHKWSLQGTITDMSAARAVNSDYTAGYTDLLPQEISTKIYGGKIQTDRHIVATIPSEAAFQKASRIAYLAKLVNIGIFEGTGSATTMKGIRQYIADYTEYSGQTVAAGSTSGGDLPTMATMDSALSLVNIVPNQTYIYSNEIERRYMSTLSRSANVGSGQQAIQWVPSEFGNLISTYSGIPWIPLIDGKGANLLSVVETTSAFTGGSASSIYIVTWGEQTCKLVQDYGPTVYPGRDGTNFEYDSMDWPVGLAWLMPRSCVRVSNVKNAVA